MLAIRCQTCDVTLEDSEIDNEQTECDYCTWLREKDEREMANMFQEDSYHDCPR